MGKFLDDATVDYKGKFLDEEQTSYKGKFIDEQQEEGPTLGGIAKQFAVGVINEAALGFPLFALEKTQGIEAREALESQATPERIARGVGTLTGFAVGAPAKVFAKGGQLATKGAFKIAPRLIRSAKTAGDVGRRAKLFKQGTKLTRAAVEGAGGFGLYELAKAPEKNFTEKAFTVPLATTLGAGLGVAGEMLKPIVSRTVSKVTKGKAGVFADQLADDVLTEVDRLRSKANGLIRKGKFNEAQEFINTNFQGEVHKKMQGELNRLSRLTRGSAIPDDYVGLDTYYMKGYKQKNPVVKEAMRYGNQEDFINSQGSIVYHGTPQKGVSKLVGKKGKPVYVTRDKLTAEQYKLLKDIDDKGLLQERDRLMDLWKNQGNDNILDEINAIDNKIKSIVIKNKVGETVEGRVLGNIFHFNKDKDKIINAFKSIDTSGLSEYEKRIVNNVLNEGTSFYQPKIFDKTSGIRKALYKQGISGIEYPHLPLPYSGGTEGSQIALTSSRAIKTRKQLETIWDKSREAIETERYSAAEGTVKGQSLFHNRLTESEGSFLQRLGENAKEFVSRIFNARNFGEMRSSRFNEEYIKATYKMTKAEKINLFKAAEGQAVPMNNKVENALKWWRKTSDDLFNEGIKLRLVSPKDKLPKYMAHMAIHPESPKHIVDEAIKAAVKRGNFKNFDEGMTFFSSYKKAFQSGEISNSFLDGLVKSGSAQNRADAQKLAEHIIKRTRMRRYSNLEYARHNFPLYDTNPDRVIPRYLEGMTRRLEEVKQFGRKDEFMLKLIDNVREAGGDNGTMRTVFDRVVGQEPERAAFNTIPKGMSQNFREFQVLTKLGLAPIANASQSANTAFVTGISNTLRGIKDSLSKEGREHAARTGAVLSSTIQDMISKTTGGGSVSSKFLKMIGFTATERANRIIAANAGKHYIQELSRKLIARPGDKYALRRIAELGVNPYNVLKRGGLTMDEILIASQKVVNKSQFRSGVLDLPLFFSSPEGKIITQFKTFAFNQAKLIKDELVNEALRGNMGPMITAVTLMPVLGEGVKDVKAVLSGKRRDKRGLERIAENMLAVGGLGILSDLWTSAQYDSLGKAAVGPTFSDIFTFLESSQKAVKGSPKQLKKFLARQVPVAGQFLRNQVK